MVRATKWAVGALVDARCTAEALVGFVAERVRAPNLAPGGIWQDQIVGMLPFLVVFQVPTSAISNVWLGFGCRGERGSAGLHPHQSLRRRRVQQLHHSRARPTGCARPAVDGEARAGGMLTAPAPFSSLPASHPSHPDSHPSHPDSHLAPPSDPSLISPSGSPDPAALHSPLRIPIMAVTCRSPSLRCHRPLPCRPGATRAARAPPRRRRPPRWLPQSRPPPS